MSYHYGQTCWEYSKGKKLCTHLITVPVKDVELAIYPLISFFLFFFLPFDFCQPLLEGTILPCTQGMSKLDPTSSYSVGESLQSEAERGRGLRWDMASVVTGELRKVNGVRQQRCVVL